jgi:hypothetical protein
MIRFGYFGLLLLALGPCVQHGYASSFGFSVNINFGAGQAVRDGAGVFDDRIWNNLDANTVDRPLPLLTDRFGRTDQSPASLVWSASAVGRVDQITSNDPDDVRLLQGFLESPSKITLQNLDQIVPNRRVPATYSLILYTFGGRDRQAGRYTVNGRSVDHIDTALFDGDFRAGINGNVLVFNNLVGPLLTIDTEGWGPINAMSLIYCRPGDVDGNGTVDVDDLETINEAVRVGDGDLNYDINLDLTVDFQDVMSWIKCSKGTCVGDVNLDGVFDSGDLVQLFQVGIYESDEVAKWTSGDWNGDFKFDSSDLLVAFQEGCYEAADAFAIDASCLADVAANQLSAIPEPTSAGLMGCGSLLWLAACRRCSRRGRSLST